MKQPKILLVEDNPDDEVLTLLAIEQSAIHAEVIVARDGQEAVDFLLGSSPMHLPVLILLDLKLPKLDGHEVLKIIRADERTQDIPVVMFTSSAQDEDVLRSYHLGINSFVQKPVEAHSYEETVRKLSDYWITLNRMLPGYGAMSATEMHDA